MILLRDVLQSLRPGAVWTLRRNDYSGLEWLDTEQIKPTEQEVTDEIARLEAMEQVEDSRQEAIKAAQILTEWEDRMRKKSLAQIKAAFDGATTAQKNDLLFALLLRWALEVK